MDYKYIEQLIERYWECETSQQEEDILRAFFAQDDVPASLARYKSLFVYEQQQKEQTLLDDSFDQRVLAAIGQTQTTAEPPHRSSTTHRTHTPLTSALPRCRCRGYHHTLGHRCSTLVYLATQHYGLGLQPIGLQRLLPRPSESL